MILIGAGLLAWAVVRINLGPGIEGWLLFGFNLAVQIFEKYGPKPKDPK